MSTQSVDACYAGIFESSSTQKNKKGALALPWEKKALNHKVCFVYKMFVGRIEKLVMDNSYRPMLAFFHKQIIYLKLLSVVCQLYVEGMLYQHKEHHVLLQSDSAGRNMFQRA